MIDNPQLKQRFDEKGIVIFSTKPPQKNQTAVSWILLSILIIALDQWSKYFVAMSFTQTTVIHVLPFLNFILRFNDGAAFSFLNHQSGWQIYFLSGISMTISIILTIWLCRIKRSDGWVAMPVSFILGGAIGNFIDRVRLHVVIDFIDFHVGHWHFATFNVADAAVSVGATCLVLKLLCDSMSDKLS